MERGWERFLIDVHTFQYRRSRGRYLLSRCEASGILVVFLRFKKIKRWTLFCRSLCFTRTKKKNTYNADSFQCEDGGAEEQRPLVPVRYVFHGLGGRHVLEHVPERNDHAGTDQEIGDHRERGQVLEITY